MDTAAYYVGWAARVPRYHGIHTRIHTIVRESPLSTRYVFVSCTHDMMVSTMPTTLDGDALLPRLYALIRTHRYSSSLWRNQHLAADVSLSFQS